MTVEVQRLMVLSMGHIEQDTDMWLQTALSSLDQGMGTSPIAGGPYVGFGWFIYCPELTVAKPDSVPDDLWAAMTFARTNQCNYLLLDRDGDYTDELTQYEW